MKVIVRIGEKEAIPVRAIPLLTDWEVLSPDVCANAFAGDEPMAPHFEGMATYRLKEDGTVQPIRARWWKNWIARRLAACSERVDSAVVGQEVDYARWQSESLMILPPAVFVWRDDFEQAFALDYGSSCAPKEVTSHDNRSESAGSESSMRDSTLDGKPAIMLLDEIDATLNFEPMAVLPDGWFEGVMDGFDVLSEQKRGEQARAESRLGPTRLWTKERLQLLAEFRIAHGTAAAANEFGVSTSRVRQLLPSHKKSLKKAGYFDGLKR